MIDAVDLPLVPDNIVYVENSQVIKVIPVKDARKGERGFYLPVKDDQGNITLKYFETAVVRTTYRNGKGEVVPFEEADIVNKVYLDKTGQVIHSPLITIYTEEAKK